MEFRLLSKSKRRVNRPISIHKQDFSHIRAIAFDIDDTFSTHGKIHPEAFSALWALKKAGYYLVPVTGRPAGWCDHIARFWPVDAIVGENGAFVMALQSGKLKLYQNPLAPKNPARKIRLLHNRLKKVFPNIQLASDQGYRIYDLAIDFCEDVKPSWSKSKVKRLVLECEKRGAHAKVSSIHVNAWYGDFNKQSGFIEAQRILSNRDKSLLDLDVWAYLGDSPNDAPMFEFIPNSIGVRNIENFLKEIKTAPKFMTQSDGGAGFAEFAVKLLRMKSSR